MSKKEKRLPPIHPGGILQKDFLSPLGLSMNKLALDLRVPVIALPKSSMNAAVLP
jgi:plasmid maintenance system antidote protein VapI